MEQLASGRGVKLHPDLVKKTRSSTPICNIGVNSHGFSRPLPSHFNIWHPGVRATREIAVSKTLGLPQYIVVLGAAELLPAPLSPP